MRNQVRPSATVLADPDRLGCSGAGTKSGSVSEFAGGVRSGAVFNNSGFFDAARRCGEKFPFTTYHAEAERKQKDCLADFMKAHGASAQAIAFMRVAPVPAAIEEIRHYGPVSVVRARMMWADASEGWALISDSGEIVPLWAPPDVENERQFRSFKKDHPDALLWADSVGWPKGRPFNNGAERLTFRFDLKVCHACASLGHALVAYDFGAHGNFEGARLTSIATSIPES